MDPRARMVSCLVAGALTLTPAIVAQEDRRGCSDHPLVSRMERFYILACEENDFASHTFVDEANNKITVEGRWQEIRYRLKTGLTAPGELMVRRNYVNALRKIGGVVLLDRKLRATIKAASGGKEIWVELDVRFSDGSVYTLRIVEKAPMAQEVAADAKALAQDIKTAGHVAVYGIYFDFDQAVVKPESAPALKEIAALLQQDAQLKLLVVGHTDNVGEFGYNLKLSQARAEAVVAALVSQYGAAKDRLQSHGVGPAAPVASNQTDEGRSRNRRVELVER